MFQCYFACSNAILGEIESEARRVSSAAVESAFKDLRASVFDDKALEESGLNRQVCVLCVFLVSSLCVSDWRSLV